MEFPPNKLDSPLLQGFYMAELEIQMSQVLGRLNGLSETLCSVMEKIDSIEDDSIPVSTPEERNTSLWSNKVSVPRDHECKM